MKIQTKISLLVVSIGIAILSFSIAIHEHLSHKVVLKDAEQNLLSLTGSTSRHIDTFFKEKVKLASTFTTSPALQRALLENNHFAEGGQHKYSAEASEYLKTQTDLFPDDYKSILLTNRYGMIVAASGTSERSSQVDTAWWRGSYHDGAGQVFLEDMGSEEFAQDYIVGIAVPVYSAGEVSGVLKCNLKVKDALESFVEQFPLREKGANLRIVGSTGRVVIDRGKDPLSYCVNSQLASMFAKEDSASDALCLSNNRERLFAYTVISTTQGTEGSSFGWGASLDVSEPVGDWYVVACISTAAVVELLHQADNFQLHAGIAATLLLALASFFLSRRISAPISRLAQAATKIGAGDLSIRIEDEGSDETASTARAFNEMAENLRVTQASRDALMQEHIRSAQLEILGTLAVGVAHEINNPTQGIMNLATMIHNSPENAERARECSEKIVTESERISAITYNLLVYAREQGQELVLSDIEELVRVAASLIGKKLELNGICLDLSFSPDIPKLEVMPQLIQQLVINLVDNAYDSLRCKQPKEDEPLIKVQAYVKDGKTIVLEVSDNGMGIAPEILDRVSEPFFTTKKSSEGTGLGLALVTEIASKHDGEIVIESELGKYTKVTLDLPILR